MGGCPQERVLLYRCMSVWPHCRRALWLINAVNTEYSPKAPKGDVMQDIKHLPSQPLWPHHLLWDLRLMENVYMSLISSLQHAQNPKMRYTNSERVYNLSAAWHPTQGDSHHIYRARYVSLSIHISCQPNFNGSFLIKFDSPHSIASAMLPVWNKQIIFLIQCISLPLSSKYVPLFLGWL